MHANCFLPTPYHGKIALIALLRACLLLLLPGLVQATSLSLVEGNTPL